MTTASQKTTKTEERSTLQDGPPSQETSNAEDTASLEEPAEGPDSAKNTRPPRERIRDFLHTLFAMQGEPLPASWPAISTAELSGATRMLRGRLDQFYQFLDHHPSQDRIQRLFARFYGESAWTMLRLDASLPDGALEAAPAHIDALAGRPTVEIAFDQLYCTPDSTERRVQKILSSSTTPEARVLFVGDDDLGSVVLSKVEDFPGEIHVIDLDDRLLSFISERAPQVVNHKIDLLMGGVPQWMHQYFDVVVLDPPWDISGAWSFLSRALYCLRDEPSARILMAFCPIQMELIGSEMRRFWQRLARYGLGCESLATACHLYDLAPMSRPDYQKAFGLYLPDVESPFMDALREVPYTFAHLYELRRIQGHKMGPLRDFLFRWWLTHNEG